jgi:hypothetical protein
MPEIKAEISWGELPVNGRPCSACDAEIYGFGHAPAMSIGKVEDLDISTIPMILCEKCFTKLKAIKK